MSKMSHTPGPWSYENEGQTVYVGDQIEGQWIAQVRGWGWLQKLKNGEAVQDANGRLIAAAPELLEALRMWMEIHDKPAGFIGKFGKSLDAAIESQQLKIDAAADAARAAIAKATGGDAA